MISIESQNSMVIEISRHNKNGAAGGTFEGWFLAEDTLTNGADIDYPVLFKMTDTIFMFF